MLNIRTMATNFSSCKGSYVLNQFPSNVMFGMNGFHGSASGAIQGHHGHLVLLTTNNVHVYSNLVVHCYTIRNIITLHFEWSFS